MNFRLRQHFCHQVCYSGPPLAGMSPSVLAWRQQLVIWLSLLRGLIDPSLGGTLYSPAGPAPSYGQNRSLGGGGGGAKYRCPANLTTSVNREGM